MNFQKLISLCYILTICQKANGKYRWRYHYYYYHPHSSGSSSEEAPPPAPALPPATQEDKDDAVKIVNSQFAEPIIASIFLHRTQDHRKVINNEITLLNHGKKWIKEKYLPNHRKNPPFKDLCFALLNEPIAVLAMYLGEFLHQRDENFIIIPLTLCQQMKQLHYIYNRRHKNGLTKRRKKQRHPFSNLMRVWIEDDRESDDVCKFTPDDVQNTTDALKGEYPHWDDERDGLEGVLIKKCLKFAAAVVQKFEKDLNQTIDSIIKSVIKNRHLVDAYTALAQYVKDKYGYMAKILLDHCNGSDRWAVWIMLIGFVTGDDWSKIDAAFMKINKNVSLKDHILSNAEADKVFLQMMAAIIDPQYKPTAF